METQKLNLYLYYSYVYFGDNVGTGLW